jgi:hypothetical protein
VIGNLFHLRNLMGGKQHGRAIGHQGHNDLQNLFN